MKFLLYIISGIITAISVVGMLYHAFWLALEKLFNANVIANNEAILMGCIALGIISALVFDKCED